MAPMPMVRVRPAMPPMPDDAPEAMEPPSDMHFEIGPQIEAALRDAGVALERDRPQIERVLRDLPVTLERVKVPTVYVDVVV
jgi:hypothetical protein